MQLFSLILVAGLLTACIKCQDLIRQEEAKGSEAVLLTIARIQQSGVFGNDNELLRRIAYVKTFDGTSLDTFRNNYHGGIWAVDEVVFLRTQNINTNSRLALKIRDIRRRFGLRWQTVTWRDLRKPLHSAIAARLVMFIANSAIPSASDLGAQATFWKENFSPSGDTSEFVSQSSSLEGSVLQSSANEFFVGFAKNLDQNDPLELSLFVTTAETQPVSFTVTANGFSFSGVATSNTSTTVSLPSSLEVLSQDDREKGIRVKAEDNKNIIVYGLSYHQFTSDAFLALPCSNLAVEEYDYYALMYSPGFRSLILLVACEDNTAITAPGLSITLNQRQTYQIEDTGDLSGTKVTASKPIALFAASECTTVPTGEPACDHLTEQIPPTTTWGSRFLVASLAGRNSGERFRIISSESATVAVNCSTYTTPVSYSLLSGNWTEFEIGPSSYCSIEASSPIFFVQFSSGTTVDGLPGDPFMMMIPPIEQYSNNYVFEVLTEDFENNFITLYVAPEHFQPQRIFLDGSILSGWNTVFCALNSAVCGFITTASLNSGEHRLFHEDPAAQIGVNAYGFNPSNSYGYPGGLRLIPVQLATISFSSSSYSVAEGNNLILYVTRSGAVDTRVVTLLAPDIFQGTARADGDYKLDPLIITFEEGETSKQVEVSIEDDKNVEVAEVFELYLSGGAGVHLSPFSRAEVTITDNDGTISLEPSHGSMLGGTGVLVTIQSSDGLQKTREDDQIVCIFDGVTVIGVFVSEEQTLCVSPQLTRTGRVSFQFRLPKSRFIAESIYTSLSFMNSFEVYVTNKELTFSSENMVNVQWSPLSIFPMESPNSYTVDIDLLEWKNSSGEWKKLLVLGSDLPNNGSAGVRIPNLENITFEETNDISLVVVSISLSNASTNPRLSKRESGSSVLQKLGRFALKTFKNTPVRYLKKLARQAIQRVSCEAWSAFEPSNIGEEINNRLPRCPRQVREVRANTGFKEEKLSSIVSVVGDIQDYFGNTVIDDTFRNFFHPNTQSCFRQILNANSETGGSGQQCCYDSNDFLITGSPGGGTVDRISPDVDLVGHLLVDVVPYLLCCKAGIFSDCDEYYKNRPSDEGIDYRPPPPPAITFGDPHIITLDGFKYTFNGKGEFVLIEMDDESFTLQGRMVPIGHSSSTADPVGTIFSAIVAKELYSSTVQVEIFESQVLVIVDGDQMNFSTVTEQAFDNVTISFLGNDTYSAAFANGAYIEVKEENEIFSVLIVSLPEAFMEKSTHGLLGSFNGNTSDDLIPRLGDISLPLSSSLESIHEQFGLTWIIDTPSGSIFEYQAGDNWNTFYDPFFTPAFEPVFSDPTLEAQAVSLCGDDVFCRFDIAATGRTDIGLSTLIGNQNYEDIVDLQIPVICSMPCVNGACVANDTCNCAAGYTGSTCNETVITECEENPCQNGGTCTRRVLSYLCDCPQNYIGDLCEIGLVNDTVISNPQMTVPLYIEDVSKILPFSQEDSLNLCFEVHGKADSFFNLVSDDCVSVNAHYEQILPSENVNIIDNIAVHTVDNDGTCISIDVALDKCRTRVGGVEIQDRYSKSGVSIRRYSNRVRISLPNCRSVAGLVMWVFCEKQQFFSRTRVNPDGTAVTFEGDAIRFVISRGLNLQDSSHGILGQFWNVPISLESYSGPFNVQPPEGQSVYVVTVNYPGKEPRHFIAHLNFPSWERRRGLHCLFAGNAQAGNVYEVPKSDVNGPVIEGKYSNYIVSGRFETRFQFSHFDSSKCS